MKPLVIPWRIVTIVAQLALVAGLIYTMFWLRGHIQSVRREIAVQLATFVSQNDRSSEIISLRDELARRQHDVDRLVAMVPTLTGISEVLTEILTEADRRNVTVIVPDVVEDEVPKNGQLGTVRFRVTAAGNPVDVLQFVHGLEQLPFLLGVVAVDFSIDQTSSSVLRSTARASVSLPPGGGQEESLPPKIDGQAKLDVVVVVLEEGNLDAAL